MYASIPQAGGLSDKPFSSETYAEVEHEISVVYVRMKFHLRSLQGLELALPSRSRGDLHCPGIIP